MTENSHDEISRLAAVESLCILNSGKDPAFDAIVQMAAESCGTPMSLITVVDADRQWIKAGFGTDIAETPRSESFCDHAIRSQDDVFVVEDASKDARFSKLPLVDQPGGIRFYAGVPLRFDGRHAVGALCVLDTEPRSLSDKERQSLLRLSTVTNSLVSRYADLRLLSVQSDELRGLASRLQDASTLFDQAGSLAGVGIWQRDLLTGEFSWSSTLYDMIETDEATIREAGDGLAFHVPEDRPLLLEAIRKADAEQKPYEFEGDIVTGKGNHRRVRIVGDTIREDGVPVRRYGLLCDVTQEHARQQEFIRLAERDSLTDLRNRRSFMAALDAADAANLHPRTLLLLDLDGFKEINDTLGHAAGDHCLRVVAGRLNAIESPDSVTGRVGGDEFTILVSGDVEDAVRVAEGIVESMREPISWRGQSIEISVSVGIAPDSTGMLTADTHMSEADLALYDAKNGGKNQAVVFKEGMRAAGENRFHVLRSIRAALADGRMELHYQPKVVLADASHHGFEALIRCRTKEGELLLPASFVEALSDPVLGVEIGNFVVREATRQASIWTKEGVPFGSIAVNLGAVQFRDRSAADMVLSEIALRRLPRGSIEVEVTEDVFMSRSADDVLFVCGKLQEGGVKISFDDFGTGHASLTHLIGFPVDAIKIDRRFVSAIDTGSAPIVDAILGLSKSIGIDVVAEGVENEVQAAYLRAAGCRLAQGWLYGKAMPADEATVLLGMTSIGGKSSAAA